MLLLSIRSTDLRRHNNPSAEEERRDPKASLVSWTVQGNLTETKPEGASARGEPPRQSKQRRSVEKRTLAMEKEKTLILTKAETPKLDNDHKRLAATEQSRTEHRRSRRRLQRPQTGVDKPPALCHRWGEKRRNGIRRKEGREGVPLPESVR